MTERLKKTLAAACAVSVAVTCFAGCSKSDKKTDSSSNSSTAEKTEDSKLDIYLDETGAPYYFDSDGTKMMLFSSPYETGDEDPSENYIYDNYDSNGLKFTIPDGWYADDSYGSPTLFMEGEEDNFDEYISIAPSMYVLDADKDGNYNTEAVIKSYYDSGVDEGYYLSYEITDKGDEKINGIDAKFFVLKVTSEDFYDDEKETSEETEQTTIRIKYIITGGDNSHAVILTSLDTDESFDKVNKAYEESIAKSLELPTAEQMAEAEEEYVDEEDFDEADIDEGDTELTDDFVTFD